MKGNSKNNTAHHKGRKSFFSGKTKLVLLLIPAILLLTGFIAATLTSNQTTPLQALNINSIGSSAIGANSVSARDGSSSGLSLTGNLTIYGPETLNGNLNFNASQAILGSPLISSGALNITADSIQVDTPSSTGDTITMSGNAVNPTTVDLYGNILIGDPTTANGMAMEITAYNQTIESYGPGYIGSIGSNLSLIINTNAAIQVLQGTLYISLLAPGSPDLIINSTTLSGALGTYDLTPYNDIANVSQILSVTTPGGADLAAYSLWWNDSITFGVLSDSVGPGSILELPSGYINMTDTHLHLVSTGSIDYQFLSNSLGAGITITDGASHFTKAQMDIVTPSQSITSLGPTIITNGSVIMSGSTTTPSQQIINSTLNYVGDMQLSNGNMTLQGTFSVGTGDFINGPASINGGTVSISSGGTMQTVGTTTITSGEMEVQNGNVIMNSSGTYIGTDPPIDDYSLILSGTIVSSGAITMSGTFVLMVPMSMSGGMLTTGVSSMGSLGTINGAMSVLGSIVLTGPTVISGVTNILGSQAVTPSGVAMTGVSSITGTILTGVTPAIPSSTILQILSGSLSSVPLPSIPLQFNIPALVALVIMILGTIYTVITVVYMGIRRITK